MDPHYQTYLLAYGVRQCSPTKSKNPLASFQTNENENWKSNIQHTCMVCCMQFPLLSNIVGTRGYQKSRTNPCNGFLHKREKTMEWFCICPQGMVLDLTKDNLYTLHKRAKKVLAEWFKEVASSSLPSANPLIVQTTCNHEAADLGLECTTMTDFDSTKHNF